MSDDFKQIFTGASRGPVHLGVYDRTLTELVDFLEGMKQNGLVTDVKENNFKALPHEYNLHLRLTFPTFVSRYAQFGRTMMQHLPREEWAKLKYKRLKQANPHSDADANIHLIVRDGQGLTLKFTSGSFASIMKRSKIPLHCNKGTLEFNVPEEEMVNFNERHLTPFLKSVSIISRDVGKYLVNKSYHKRDILTKIDKISGP